VLRDYLLGVGLFVGLGVFWALVQAGWRRAFPESAPGGDALAGRLGCRGCGECGSNCERPDAHGAPVSRR
jgi:hypothetical protein